MADVYVKNGKKVSREVWLKGARGFRGGVAATQIAANWPMHSDALAVHPDQVQEATESARKRGVPTEYNAEGLPKLESRGHRRRLMKAYGYNDNDGGYGDA